MPTPTRLIGLYGFSRIAIGTSVGTFEGGPGNVARALKFLRSELDQHDNDVAIAICLTDGACFGIILSKWQIPESVEKFERFLTGLGFYEATHSD
ncbi:hypothetical protein LMG28614_07280 [Paraburkholderia ultramafica]|uniref:Uncharacterized protein n=2 Tax=Paraburkholderia ultramafica TaxID=1544867 RepID=A0A6S7D884_9BURK|nr:hypothetical protein LMG28614_07280 [Paraburkholderia ultramafica]